MALSDGGWCDVVHKPASIETSSKGSGIGFVGTQRTDPRGLPCRGCLAIGAKAVSSHRTPRFADDWHSIVKEQSRRDSLQRITLSRPEPYEMAEFVSPWQCFGGVCDFVIRCLARF